MAPSQNRKAVSTFSSKHFCPDSLPAMSLGNWMFATS